MRFNQEFEAIYIRYSDKIYRYLYLQTHDPFLAEDITGEVFLRAWKNWQTIKLDFIQALLFKIAKNILIDHWRKQKEKKELSLETTIESGMEPSYDVDLISKIQKDNDLENIMKCLAKLSENLKEVVILRFVEDLSCKEAAEIMQTSEGNIRILQYRALNKIKEIMKNDK